MRSAHLVELTRLLGVLCSLDEGDHLKWQYIPKPSHVGGLRAQCRHLVSRDGEERPQGILDNSSVETMFLTITVRKDIIY